MEVKLLYFTQACFNTNTYSLATKIVRTNLTKIHEGCQLFFKADKLKTIKRNSEEVAGECTGHTDPLKFEIGKEYSALVGDPLKVKLTRTGTELIMDDGIYHELKVTDKFYIYSRYETRYLYWH